MSTFSGVSYDTKSYLQHRPSYPDSLYKELKNYVGLGQNAKCDLVVDIGCGSGQATQALLDQLGSKVVGVDPSQYMLEQAHKNLERFGSRVELKIGHDKNLAQLFAANSVDLLAIAEAAHWLEYPQFWKTAHTLLKPQGTLAMWAYYTFSFIGYPESAGIFRRFSIGKDKCGPYWGAGRERLDNMYDDLVPPSDLFEKEVRIVSKVDDYERNSPFDLRREGATVGDMLALLNTYSGYHTWKEAKTGKPDILEETAQELFDKTGLTVESKVDVKWETVMIFVKAKK